MHIGVLIDMLLEHQKRGVVQVDIQLYDRWSDSIRSYPLEETQLVPHGKDFTSTLLIDVAGSH